MVTALNRKLLRDLVRIWPQVLAIALVLSCGIMVLVLANGTQAALTQTQAAYYDRYRFADVFSSATRAPRAMMREIEAVPGIARAEARIVTEALIRVQGEDSPGTAHVVSLPESGAPRLNLLVLRGGRLPDPLHTDEVVVAEPFADANSLHPGDGIEIVVNGQARRLVVTGTALSPEFVYTLAPGSMMPDDKRHAVLWMNEGALASALDLAGAFNDLSLTLLPGAQQAGVIAAVDRLLEPFGGTGAYGRDRQQSHAFLQNELTQLRAMALYLPPVFLIVSAMLVNMVLGRLLRLERRQIGLLKALGYSTRRIVWHFLKLALGIGVPGVLIGWAAGWAMGHWMTEIYTQFFRFPFLIYTPEPAAFAISGVLGMLTVLIGAARSVLATTALPPSVAMSPPAPAKFQRSWADRIARRARLKQTSMMILRSITRWPARALVTIFGVTASVAVLVASYFTFDMIDVVMADIFEATNRQQVTLTLSAPRGVQAVQDALTLPGVRRAEGALVLPIRLHHGVTSRLVTVQAMEAGATLSRVLDSDGHPAVLPDQGIALPESLAEALNVRLGDVVTMDLLAPPRESWDVPVTAVIRQSMGQQAHMSAPALQALRRSATQVNTLHLLVDPGAMPALRAKVMSTPAIAGLTDWSDVRAQFVATMNTSLLTMTVIYSALGMLITLGVIYNAARIQLAERQHELISLRVFGFSRGEVRYILIGEQMVLTLAAILPGWLLGYGFAAMMVRGFSSELVRLPLVIDRRTFAYAALAVLATASVTLWRVARGLDHVDLVGALKQRE